MRPSCTMIESGWSEYRLRQVQTLNEVIYGFRDNLQRHSTLALATRLGRKRLLFLEVKMTLTPFALVEEDVFRHSAEKAPKLRGTKDALILRWNIKEIPR